MANAVRRIERIGVFVVVMNDPFDFRFWILDFGFWIFDSRLKNGKGVSRGWGGGLEKFASEIGGIAYPGTIGH